MSELKKHKFSDLYSMSSGISSKPEQAGHGSPFLTFSDVFNNYFVPDSLTNLMDTSEKEQETYSIKKGDIFLTRTSETIDELGMSCVALKDYPNATYSGFVKRLRPLQDDVTYEKYMGFYLRSRFFRKTMTNNAVLTLRASLNEEIYSYLHLYLPDYKTQKNVGDFLLLLNEKIALNNRINAELEAMAKTLYDYWFVQFDFPNEEGKPYKTSGGAMVWNEELKREIPEGWEVDKLDKVVSIVRGASPRPIDDYLSDEGVNWIKISDATESNNRFIVATKQFIIQEGVSKSRFLKPNTLILSNSASPAIPRIVKIESCVHDGWLIIDKYKDGLTIEYLYHYFDNERPNILNLGNGSIFKNLKTEYLKEYKMVIPPKSILDQFMPIFKDLSDKVYINTLENQQLATLRDWLLPMLMNGQVVVE